MFQQHLAERLGEPRDFEFEPGQAKIIRHPLGLLAGRVLLGGQLFQLGRQQRQLFSEFGILLCDFLHQCVFAEGLSFRLRGPLAGAFGFAQAALRNQRLQQLDILRLPIQLERRRVTLATEQLQAHGLTQQLLFEHFDFRRQGERFELERQAPGLGEAGQLPFGNRQLQFFGDIQFSFFRLTQTLANC